MADEATRDSLLAELQNSSSASIEIEIDDES